MNDVLNSPAAMSGDLIAHGNADIVGYIAAMLTIATYSMRTMIPLRVVGICANCLFIAYGYFAAVYPQLLLHAILLPLNGLRLYQMIQLIAMVKRASEDDLSMDWVKTFTSTRDCHAGEIVFAKGDVADAMYYAMSGRYVLNEIGVEIAPGQVVGEMGWVSPDRRRTQTFTCVEPGQLLEITYRQVKMLYFQNPRFGFFFLKLITQRLFANQQKTEERLELILQGMPQSGGTPPAVAAAPGNTLINRRLMR
jgi:CRP/FNR family transcriptional regulator, cyclic AMP receptor protein